jgi:hypothetical protein
MRDALAKPTDLDVARSVTAAGNATSHTFRINCWGSSCSASIGRSIGLPSASTGKRPISVARIGMDSALVEKSAKRRPRRGGAYEAFRAWRLRCCEYSPIFVLWFGEALAAREDVTQALALNDFCADCDADYGFGEYRLGRCVNEGHLRAMLLERLIALLRRSDQASRIEGRA